MSSVNGPQTFLRELGATQVSDEFREIWMRLSAGMRGEIIIAAGAYCSAMLRSGNPTPDDPLVVLFPYSAESKIAAYALWLGEHSGPPFFLQRQRDIETAIRLKSDRLAIRDLRNFFERKSIEQVKPLANRRHHAGVARGAAARSSMYPWST